MTITAAHNDLCRHLGESPNDHSFKDGRPAPESSNLLEDPDNKAVLSGEMDDPDQMLKNRRRKVTCQSFIEAEASLKLRRAALARHRTWTPYQSGKWVYDWRKKKGVMKPGRWHGPAMVLKQEEKKYLDGSQRVGSIVWIVAQGKLLRAAPNNYDLPQKLKGFSLRWAYQKMNEAQLR